MDKETKLMIEDRNSVVVAKKAFWQTALTRVLIPVPSMSLLLSLIIISLF